jgi:hypothetical protein
MKFIRRAKALTKVITWSLAIGLRAKSKFITEFLCWIGPRKDLLVEVSEQMLLCSLLLHHLQRRQGVQDIDLLWLKEKNSANLVPQTFPL